MAVPGRDTLPAKVLRYVLAALCMAVAAWGLIMLPAHADCAVCQHAPPPAHHCDCQPAAIVVPTANVPAPNVVTMNNAQASAQANAQSFSIAVARTGDIVVRTGGVSDTSVGAGVAVSSNAFAVEERVAVSSADFGRAMRVAAVCLDTSNREHPASPTSAGASVATDFVGEIFRCTADARAMRVSVQGRSFYCAAGQALWYEHAQLSCKVQMISSVALPARFASGDKIVLLREPETQTPAHNPSLNAAVMAMDGGVGFN